MPELILIRLFTDTAERVDTVKAFLEDNGAREVNCYKGSSEDVIKGECSATAPVSLLRSLAEQPGVLRINKEYVLQPASNLQSPSSQQTPADAHGATTWRLAGADGTGVKVGIIDYGFKDFRTRLPNLTPAAKPFCYDTNGVLSKTNISSCESNIGLPPGDDHGTEVAEALIETAPNISLYIANANTLPRIKAAVDWMGANDVDVINFSLSSVWDGPGDGTSPSAESTLNSLDDAVDADILWVSAAGNEAENIWFKRGINLTSTRYVDFDPGPNRVWCKNITNGLQSGKQYTFHLRWEGVWNNEDSDFNLHLYRTGSIPAWAAHSREIQNGGAMQFPLESLNYTRTATGTGNYCLAISLASGDSVPAWVQLLAFHQSLDDVDSSGSIMNPAESVNAGMLAVGASDYNPMAIKDFSGRGPAPEPAPNAANPLGRIKPDIVGANEGTVIGTSYAAPRVAGLAAMVMQALTNPSGTRPAPTQVVGYLKQHAQPRSESVPAGTPTPTPGHNNTWGHGFAKLPPPPPPTSLALRLDSSNSTDLLLDYTNSSWDASSAHRYHFVLERLVNQQWQTFALNSRVSASPVRFSGLTQGYTYRAKGKRCVVATAISCGEWSTWSASRHLAVPLPAVPTGFIATGGNGSIALDWNDASRATSYQVQQWNGSAGQTLPYGSFTVAFSGSSATVGGLSNGQSYWHRVRSYNNQAYSGWSGWRSARPTAPAATPTPTPQPPAIPTGLTGTAGNGSITLDWNDAPRATSYQVQQWARRWRTLPFTESHVNYSYTITFNGSGATVGKLTNGVTYYHWVRAVNSSGSSAWTSYIGTTPIGTTPTSGARGTAGDSPPPPPDQ